MNPLEAFGATPRTISRLLRLLLIGGTALSACATSREQGPVPVAATTDTTVATAHDRHQNQGEATMYLTLSLEALRLSPDQQAAITKIRADLQAAMEPSRAAEQRVFAMLAEGVAAGAVDEKAVAPAISELGSASAGASDAAAAALNQLHAQLTPSAREVLVEKLRQHWAFFPPDDDAQETLAGKRVELMGLGLSVAQADALLARSSALPTSGDTAADPWRIDARLHRLDAFKDGTFDARTFSRSTVASARVAKEQAERKAHFYEAIAPLLTADQRSKLAEALRNRGSRVDVERPGVPAKTSAR